MNAAEPTPTETLDAYLDRCGIEHFSALEVLTMRRAGIVVPEPPRDWWHRIVPTLLVAEQLREEVGCPLVVGNGYRPEPYNSRVGGARRSQHLFFRALDIDLPASKNTRERQERLYQAAGAVYLSEGDKLRMGLGLYRMHRGSRVHIDTGYRKRAWKREFVRALLDELR